LIDLIDFDGVLFIERDDLAGVLLLDLTSADFLSILAVLLFLSFAMLSLEVLV
jgi:hypothetical protein